MSTTKIDTKKYLANLQDERNGVALYRLLAEVEKDQRIAELYRRFAATEERHADAWAARLEQTGAAVPPFRPSWRTRVFSWLARRFGPGIILPSLKGMEQVGASGYSRQAGAAAAGSASLPAEAAMGQDEASHARLLQQIITSNAGGGEVAQIEGRHRAGGGNALRAAVLGANDGLVSNLSLVMGVAGAQLAGNNAILITGLAGLLAGACSMALGEWLSVQSSRELYQRQIEIEKAEIEAAPQEEAEELALIYESRGVGAEQARQMAQSIVSNPDSALATLTREELAIDPKELGGSAWVAAGISFCLFALGAAIPVIPFFFLAGRQAVITSGAISAVALFGIGSAITLFTGRSPLWSGLRMVLFSLAAAAITFTVGHLIGVQIGG